MKVGHLTMTLHTNTAQLRKTVTDLIACDAYAITFQTLGQYRTALMREIEKALADNTNIDYDAIDRAPEEVQMSNAQLHGCAIKVKYGDERGLEMELRKTQGELDILQAQISNVTTEVENSAQEMITNHRIALRREEEKGYARGLADGRTLVEVQDLWEPIETAPEDQVFLMAQSDDEVTDCWQIRVGYKSKQYSDFVALGCRDFKPTHWMRLPSPPCVRPEAS